MKNYRTVRIFRRVTKALFSLFIFSVCALIIWRMCSSQDPKEITRLLVNKPLTQAYAEYGDDLVLQGQTQATITKAENNYGYFSVTQCVFVPQAEQVQLVFRYNNSTLRHLQADYQLEEVPSKDGTYYDVTLVRTTDRTPDITEDNNDLEQLDVCRYHATQVERTTSSLYTYYRYVFDGVDIPENTLAFFADVYYLEDLNYDAEPYGTLLLYDSSEEWDVYALPSADKKTLREAAAHLDK